MSSDARSASRAAKPTLRIADFAAWANPTKFSDIAERRFIAHAKIAFNDDVSTGDG